MAGSQPTPSARSTPHYPSSARPGPPANRTSGFATKAHRSADSATKPATSTGSRATTSDRSSRMKPLNPSQLAPRRVAPQRVPIAARREFALDATPVNYAPMTELMSGAIDLLKLTLYPNCAPMIAAPVPRRRVRRTTRVDSAGCSRLIEATRAAYDAGVLTLLPAGWFRITRGSSVVGGVSGQFGRHR